MLERVAPLRRRKPAALCIMQTVSTNSGELLNPASAYAQRTAEHELVDMTEVAKGLFAAKKGRKDRKKRVCYQRGKCMHEGCTKKARAKFRCPACGEGKGAFYHLPCFFKTHRCCRGSRV